MISESLNAHALSAEMKDIPTRDLICMVDVSFQENRAPMRSLIGPEIALRVELPKVGLLIPPLLTVCHRGIGSVLGPVKVRDVSGVVSNSPQKYTVYGAPVPLREVRNSEG